ncbi:MAG: patatin-like phospholipase family protein [Deltaproteobacteria bacterium]|nr:patatin-like phospholipase family protein [Deltaproteobacteria bacterium]
MGPQFSNSQQWMHLVSLLKYNLFFSTLLLFLPLTAVEGVWLNAVTGNLFVDLAAGDIFWATILLLSVFWSLMIIAALAVDDHAGIWLGPFWRRAHPTPRPAGYLPPWAVTFFGFPTTPPQFAFFTFLALPGVVVTVWYAHAWWLWSIGAAFSGAVGTYLAFMSICLLVQLTDPQTNLIPRNRLVDYVWSVFTSQEWLTYLVRKVWQSISWLFSFSPFKYLLNTSAAPGPRILIGHLLATFTLAVLTSFLIGIASWGYPGSGGFADGWMPLELSPVAYVYILFLWLIWLFGVLEFHIPRWLGMSPLVFLLLLIFVGYQVSETDHYYCPVGQVCQKQATKKTVPSPFPTATAEKNEPTAAQEALTPLQTATAGKSENLVIIASAGGGILAAGWTTLALKMLICQRPALLKEIRLLSTVSGGSVGAAYYLDALKAKAQPADSLPSQGCAEEPDQWLEEIHQKSIQSSLGATAYGFAFPDFWRITTGGGVLWPFHDLSTWEDRGSLLEKDWARIAAGYLENRNGGVFLKADKVENYTQYAIGSLKAKIGKGLLPDFIFNATDMESGMRVMITPTTFDSQKGHAETLTELLSAQDATAGEQISLWTAARLSATFPWVSPAARTRFDNPVVSADRRPEHHLIDGGYHDNFGVVSALEWLHTVLQQGILLQPNVRQLDIPYVYPATHKIQEVVFQLPFKRIAIVQLRAFRPKDAQEQPPQGGAISAFLGPLIGLANIRDAAAHSRNEFELERFVTLWNERLQNQGKPITLKTFVFEPSAETDSGPLSWQLSESQKDRLLCSWYDEKKVRTVSATSRSCKEAIAALKARGQKEFDFWTESLQHTWKEMNAFLTQE